MKTILLLSFFLFFSCSDDSFKKVEKLGDFRVLGIQASNSEVNANTNVSFNLLISDIDGGGRVVALEIEGCTDPGVTQGAQPNCDHDPAKFSASVPDITASLNAPNYTEMVTLIPTVPVSVSILTGRSARDQFNGVGYLVTFTFDVEGEKIKTFKRIIVTNRSSLNSNPSFDDNTDLLLNGSEINNSLPAIGDKLTLKAGNPENYQFQNIDGSIEDKTEKFEIAWYSSYGEFSKPKSFTQEEVELKTSKTNSTASVFVVVIRDGRGGLDYIIKE